MERCDRIVVSVCGQHLQIDVQTHRRCQITRRVEYHVAFGVDALFGAGRVGVVKIPVLESEIVQIGERRVGGEFELVVQIRVPHRRVDPVHSGHGRIIRAGPRINGFGNPGVDPGGAPVIGP